MPGLEWLRADRDDSSFHYWSGALNLFQTFAITGALSTINNHFRSRMVKRGGVDRWSCERLNSGSDDVCNSR
jgi:hypothetical protein